MVIIEGKKIMKVTYLSICLDNVKSAIVYTYPKHDAKGNWIEEITDEKGEQTAETRIRTYYE